MAPRFIYGMRWVGQYRPKYVRDGLLAATVVVPPNTRLAFEMLVSAMRDGKTPPEQVLTVPASFPSLEELIRAGRDKKPSSS